ncbi:MAG: EutN/CcmL family microcompartment protein [Candidatus Poribacteria bacterium]|nr:EutN/CcmL family microcompartment protein [Candidatus Poribacteria bacterium]
MYIAKVIGKVVSIVKHPAYENRTLLLVQPLSLKSKLVRTPTIAVDYVGAGEGDVVLVGAGPGVAQEVFGVENAPIRELVMGIIDRFDVSDVEAEAP